MFDLNLFQSEALREISNAEENGERRFAVVMPTGTGKTYLIAEWFRTKLHKNPSARLLYVCHNQDILTQANDKEFTTHLKDLNISRGYYNASKKSVAQITFATVQTLSRNLAKFSPDHFDYIIVDEAHHYRAKTFEETVQHFAPKLLIGLTATPSRMDKKSILEVFNKVVYTAKISTGIRDGLLSKIKYYCVDDDIDFSDIKWNGRSYSESDLNKKLCIPEYDKSVLREYVETIRKAHGKTKTICFCATVEHAHRMNELFNRNNIRAVALTGKHRSAAAATAARISLHDGSRDEIINGFRDGVYEIIFVRDLFNEGVDIPDADSIMMLRPTQSDTIFTQQLGRGLRVSPHKDYLLVLDFTGNCHNCSINFDVLDELMDIDINKEVLAKVNSANSPRAVVIRNLGCEIRLSKKKIDVINDVITREKLIYNYYLMKEKLSHHPTAKDLNNREVSLYCAKTYTSRFGSWNKFLMEIDEPLNQTINVPKEQLISNYYSVKKKLLRQPTRRDINNRRISQHSVGPYVHQFGSWNDFLIEINEPVNMRHIKDVSKEQLISNYYSAKEKLLKQPTSADINNHEISRYGKGRYDVCFGSWTAFLKEINEPILKSRMHMTDEQLISNFYSVKAKLSRQPTSADMNNREVSQYGNASYRTHFGSWGKFLLKIEETMAKLGREKITKEQLVSNYYSLKERLSRQPTPEDINDRGLSHYRVRTYKRLFGSIRGFLKEIDEPTPTPLRKGVTREILISNYYAVKKLLSRQPVITDINNHEISEYGMSPYARQFGSWNKFLREINEPEVHALNISREQLISNYHSVKAKLSRQPRRKDIDNRDISLYGNTPYKRLFGSWNRFLLEINEPVPMKGTSE